MAVPTTDKGKLITLGGLEYFYTKLKTIFVTKDEAASTEFKLVKNADDSVSLEWYKP